MLVEFNGILIHRPNNYDSKEDLFGTVIDLDTFEKKIDIILSENLAIKRNTAKSIALLKCNDQLLWLKQIPSDAETMNYLPQSYITVIDYCTLESNSENCTMKVTERRLLTKSIESLDVISKVLNLLLMPCKTSSATESDVPMKFPTDNNSTSAGLRMATFQESAITCDGTFLTVLAPNPDSRGKLSKCLGTAFSFELEKGTLHSQAELNLDQSTITPVSLPKGYTISSSSILYLPQKHKFWSVAYNRIDEYNGPSGMESGSYLRFKIYGDANRQQEDKQINDVRETLLEHAAIELLKSKANIKLKEATLEMLVNIGINSFNQNKPQISRTILQMLTKIDAIDGDFHQSINSFLTQLLHSSYCDRYMVDQILMLLQEHSPNKQIEFSIIQSNLKSNLPMISSQMLRKYYLNHSVNFKVCESKDEATFFLEEVDNEFKINIQDTLKQISHHNLSKKGYTLEPTSSTATLVNLICTIGDHAIEKQDVELFLQLSQLTMKNLKIMVEKLFNIEKKPSCISEYLTMSILGPTFIGSFFCMLSQVPDVKEALQEKSHELFYLIARLLSSQDSQAAERLTRKDLESNLPWIFSKNISSPHPIKEGFKYQETVKLPGVRCLYLMFNDKCSTSTDQDKLAIYAGPSVTGNKKMLEYCGNSRTTKRIGQKSWPKKPVLVMGDTVTFDFEVKGRQDADSQISWGFEVAIGHCPHDLFEPLQVNVLQNALLTIGPIITEHISKLFQGSPLTNEEAMCSNLLSTKIFQKCHWKEDKVEKLLQIYDNQRQDKTVPVLATVPRNIISGLKTLSGIGLPIMRESVKKLIQPSLMEEAIISVVIKYMGLQETVNSYMQEQDPNTPDGCLLGDIMMDVYLRISSLLRKLQTIAELEKKWNDEVFSIREGLVPLKDAFFAEYLHHEMKTKDLNLLFFLKNVKEETSHRAVQSLLALLEKEVHNEGKDLGNDFFQTKALTKAIFDRLDILLKADTENVNNTPGSSQIMTSSLQNWPQSKNLKRQQSAELEKSLDDSILQINKLHRSVSRLKQSRSIIESSILAPLDLNSNPETLVNDLFDFIGSNPEKSVSPTDFLRAILHRLERCQARMQALEKSGMIMQILEKVPLVTKYMMCSLTKGLSGGLRFQDLLCSQAITSQVMDSYNDMLLKLTSTLDLADPNMAVIGHLSSAPFQKSEGKCLAKCGLLPLLDKLTDNQEVILSDQESIGSYSWTCFKLISKRCMQWEDHKQQLDALSSSEFNDLEKQISRLLSNHLNQAVSCSHSSFKFDAVHECLSLLKDLSTTKLGKGTLAQPECMTNMFHFLCDPYLSPQAMHTVISLIQLALPFMPSSDIVKINLPSKQGHSGDSKCKRIIEIIVDRLAFFIFPSQEKERSSHNSQDLQSDVGDPNNSQSDDGGAIQALFLHKRPDQTGHELIQQLLNASGDIGIFSAMGSDSMEKIIKIDKDINQHGCAEVLNGDATRILRTANKMASIGFVVSISAPNQFHDSSSGWKHRSLQICNQRNSVVAQSTPSRPFISSNVANKLSTELIVLIHRLVCGMEGDQWLESLRDTISKSFARLVKILDHSKVIVRDKTNEDHDRLLQFGQKIIASLAILGGFYETLKPGCAVKQRDSKPTLFCDSIIKSVNKENATATVNANDCMSQEQIEINIPLRKLKHEDNLQETSQKILASVAQDLVPYLQSFLLPTDDGTEPLCYPLPVNSSNNHINSFARLIAEVRTRSCQVLALHMTDEQFARKFLEESCQSVDMLKYFAKEAQPSDKECCSEFLCANLRAKFKDQIRQTSEESIISSIVQNEAQNHWNTMQLFPPIKNIIFMHNTTGISYLGQPVTSIGLPRGIFVQSVQAMPIKTEPVYFTINILSLGETNNDTGAPTISIGLSPPNTKKDGAWNHAEGSVVLHSNGRIVHYNGSNMLNWHSMRVDHLVCPGDEVKVLWMPTLESNGKVQFEVNGSTMGNAIENVPGGLLPTIHIQQKGVRINASFPPGGQNSNAGGSSSTEDTVDKTADAVDSDRSTSLETAGHRRQSPQLARQAIRIKPVDFYNVKEVANQFRLELNGYSRVFTGGKTVQLQDTDWLDEEDDDEFDEMLDERGDDVNALLVKTWEEKVFPSIRRRFRNESERRDGLDQVSLMYLFQYINFLTCFYIFFVISNPRSKVHCLLV